MTTNFRGKDVKVVLTIQYHGLRATQYFSRASDRGALRLKMDLELLKFPSPKIQNIKFVSHGCMMAIWINPNEQTRQSLHSGVYRVPTRSGPFNRYKSKDLKELGIQGFALQTMPENDTPTADVNRLPHYNVAHSQSGPSPAGPSNGSNVPPHQQTTQRPARNSGPFPLSPKRQSSGQANSLLGLGQPPSHEPAQSQTGMSQSRGSVLSASVRQQQSGPSTSRLARSPPLPASQADARMPQPNLNVQQQQQGILSTSSPVSQGKRPSMVKRIAEDQDGAYFPNKRVKAEPAELYRIALNNGVDTGANVMVGNTSTSMTSSVEVVAGIQNLPGVLALSHHPSAVGSNSESAVSTIVKFTGTNAFNARTANPARNKNQGEIEQAWVQSLSRRSQPSISKPLTPSSLSRRTNATLPLLSQQVTSESRLPAQIPQALSMSCSPVQMLSAVTSVGTKRVHTEAEQSKPHLLENRGPPAQRTDHEPSKRPKLDTVNPARSVLSSNSNAQSGEDLDGTREESDDRMDLSVEETMTAEVNARPDGRNAELSTAQAGDALMGINQPQPGSSTSHQNAATLATKEDRIKELERQLGLLRRELKERLDQELKLYRQIQETDPAYKPGYPRCLVTRFKDLQQTLNQRDKELEAQRTVKAIGKAPGSDQEMREKLETELREERRIRVEIEEHLTTERDMRSRLAGELFSERTRLVEVEEELQREGKLRLKADDERLKIDVARQAMKVERDRYLALVDSVSKERDSLREHLEKERASRVQLQTKTEDEQVKSGELERRLDEEGKRRTELEEELERERGRRIGAEATLKDIERECKAPFVVPALLEAFATISNLTTQVMGADA